MELYDYFKFAAALVFVLCLMGGLSYVLRRFNLGQGRMISPADRRLKIVEVLPLDARRKAMLIKRDDTEHLVILNASGETVVETNIKAPAATKKNKTNDKKAASQK